MLESVAGAYDPYQLPPFEFAAQDVQSVRAPLARVASLPGAGSQLTSLVLRTPEDVATLMAALDSLPSTSSDVVIVYLAAHGVSRDGRAYLLCQNFTPATVEQASFPVDRLLRQLQLSPAGTKLLLLDHGKVACDPRLGIVVNEFPRLLQETVAALRTADGQPDSSVWVLAAHSPLEQSHADYERQHSVFAAAVAQALGGRADADRNQLVSLDELVRYVRREVYWRVLDTSQGRWEQTPQLLHAADTATASGIWLLSAPPQLPDLETAAGGLATLAPDAAKKVEQAQKKGAEQADAVQQQAAASQAALATATGDKAGAAEGGGDAGNATAAPAAGGATAGGETGTAAGPAADARASFPPRDAPLAQAVEYGWNQSAVWEANSAGLVSQLPLHAAPGWWRAWKEQLLARERQARFAAAADQPTLTATLRQDLATLFVPEQAALRPQPDLIARQLAQLRSAPPAIQGTIPSATWLEQWSAPAARLLPTEPAERLAALDKLLSGEEPDDFRERLGKLTWSRETDRYRELWLARQWSERSTVRWPTWQLAWQACRQGERVAADAGAARPWARTRLAQADSWRLAGQRELTSQIGAAWSGRAEFSLREALRQYQLLAADLATWRDCETLRASALLRAPEFVRWHHLAAGDPALAVSFDDLAAFLAALEELTREMEAELPVQARLVDLRDRVAALEARLSAPFQEARIESWLRQRDRPAERAVRLERLLQTTLCPPPVRTLLLAAAAESSPVESVAPAGSPPTSFATGLAALSEAARRGGAARREPDAKILNPASWKSARHDLLLARRLARLAVFPEPDDAGAGPKLERVWRQWFDEEGVPKLAVADAPYRDETYWEAYRAYGAALAEFYDGLPQRLTAALRRREDLSDDERRPAQLRALEALRRIECLLDPRDIERLGDASPARVWRQAALYDSLRLQYERAVAAVEDASLAESEWESAAARQFAAAAAALPLQPPLAPLEERVVSWEGPSSIALAGEPKRDVTLTLSLRERTAQRVWIVLDYDTDLLDVRGPPGANISLESELRSTAPPGAAPYPVRPDRWDRPPTFELAPGSPYRWTLTFRRRPQPGQRTLVVVKAVCGEQVVRQELSVALPATDTLALVPEGPPDSWTPQPDGVILHPLAGHSLDYRLQLVNRGVTERKLRVEFLPATSRIPGDTPDEFLSLPPDEVLRRSQVGPPLLTLEPIVLPPDGQPVLLPGPPPQGKPAAPAPAPTTAPEAGAAPSAGQSAPPGTDVRHGLLLVLRDLESRTMAVRRIQFRPQRPSRYLLAEADYDALSERLSLRVRPRNVSQMPPRGYRVAAHFADPLPPGTEAQLEGLITAAQPEVRLYANLPAEAARAYVVHLDVDDYPRGFTWLVPSDRTQTQLPPAQDRMAVQIREPEPGAAYLAPLASLPVEFAVDAPWGAFESPRDYVEIGIDRRRDRELLDDPALRLFSDRQADIALTSWSPDGTVTLATEVHDFRVTLPAAGLRNLRADLLAHLRIGTRSQWSDPVGVLFDAAGPTVQHVELAGGRTLVLMGEAAVTVSASDDQQSGVGKVEVGFDRENKGEFGAAPPIPAVPLGDGRWLAKLPVDLAVPGPTRLLVRATDKVGNEGEYAKVPVVVVTKQEAETRAKLQTNRVSGVVLFSKQVVPAAKVELRDEKQQVVAVETTDDQGRFAFPQVPLGKYRLRVRGISRNRSREKELDVVVPPPPAQSVQLEIQLSM